MAMRLCIDATSLGCLAECYLHQIADFVDLRMAFCLEFAENQFAIDLNLESPTIARNQYPALDVRFKLSE